jgi:hypothetical protein
MRSLVCLVVLAVGCHETPTPSQPIAFNHSLHLSLDLEGRPVQCVDCHAGAERAEHAGLPALRDCLRCHMRPQGGADGTPSEKEQSVRALAATGGPFRWTQVTRNPGHVYASHRAHVGIAGIECATCHGDVSRWTAPPTTPNQGLLDMGRCIDCHRARGASTECGTCHR